jgi:hypothetical protein
MYSCEQCGIVKQLVTVAAREDEDVVEWVNKAALVMGRDHYERSPNCKITKLDEVWIPLRKNGGKVGEAL